MQRHLLEQTNFNSLVTQLLPQKSLSYIDYIKISACVLPRFSKHFSQSFDIQAELDGMDYAKRSVFIASLAMVQNKGSQSPTKTRDRSPSKKSNYNLVDSPRNYEESTGGKSGNISQTGLADSSAKLRKGKLESDGNLFRRPSKNFRNILNIDPNEGKSNVNGGEKTVGFVNSK